MIEVPEDQLPEELREWAKEIDDVMRVAVANAIEENKRLGLHEYAESESPPETARVAKSSDEDNS